MDKGKALQSITERGVYGEFARSLANLAVYQSCPNLVRGSFDLCAALIDQPKLAHRMTFDYNPQLGYLEGERVACMACLLSFALFFRPCPKLLDHALLVRHAPSFYVSL